MPSRPAFLPNQALRLCALGTLWMDGAQAYADLSAQVRSFTAQALGPTPQMTSSSLELLRFDGLVEAVEGEAMADNAVLAITQAGRDELRSLILSTARGATADLNRLLMLLRLRFVHLLPPADRRALLERLIEQFEGEGSRLKTLFQGQRDAPGLLPEWLDLYQQQQAARVEWLRRKAREWGEG